MKYEILPRDEMVRRIYAHGSEGFFSIAFIRRTDSENTDQQRGDPRVIRSARRGVTKFLKGGEPAYDFAKKELISLYDFDMKLPGQKPGYKCAGYEGIICCRIAGVLLIAEDAVEKMIPVALGGAERNADAVAWCAAKFEAADAAHEDWLAQQAAA